MMLIHGVNKQHLVQHRHHKPEQQELGDFFLQLICIQAYFSLSLCRSLRLFLLQLVLRLLFVIT